MFKNILLAVIVLISIIALVRCDEVNEPRIKFYYPDQEALDVCSTFIEGLIELDTAKMRSVIVNVNSTDADPGSKVFELNNHHIKADWNGTIKKGANGRFEIGGFNLVGLDAFNAASQQFDYLVDKPQCSLSDQNIYIESFLGDNRANPFYGKYHKKCIWRGYLGGFVKQGLVLPGFEKVTFENGYYTMALIRDKQTGKLLIEKVIAIDLEIPVPEVYHADLYAETDKKKRCRKFRNLVEPRYHMYEELIEYISGEKILSKN